MKIYIIEDGLRDGSGHYLNNCLALKKSAEKSGLETKFIVHKEADLSVIDAISGTPCIAFNQFDRVSRDPLCGNLESHLIQSSTVARNLFPILSGEVSPCDIIFYPTASFNQLAALGIIIDKVPSLRNLKFIFNFVIQDFLVKGGKTLNQNASFYRMAANRLRNKIPQNNLLLSANGKDMVSALSFIMKMQVYQYPIPKHYPEQLVRKSIQNSPIRRPLIGVFGSMYGPQKGLHLIPGLVDSIQGVDWLIQEPSPQKKHLWNGAEAQIKSFKNVVFLDHILSSVDYYDYLNSVDIVLTPYMLGLDKIQSSGIISEAAASGKVIVAPANSWLVEHIKSNDISGCIYFEWTVESIGKSIQEALVDLKSLKQKALVNAIQWQQKQSADAYLSKALEFFALNH